MISTFLLCGAFVLLGVQLSSGATVSGAPSFRGAHGFWNVTPTGEQSTQWLEGAREEDLAPLTRIAQAFIQRGQHPESCAGVQFLTGAAYAVPNQGIGGVVHVASLTLLVSTPVAVRARLQQNRRTTYILSCTRVCGAHPTALLRPACMLVRAGVRLARWLLCAGGPKHWACVYVGRHRGVHVH